MTTTKDFIYNGMDVRTAVVNGEPWFVAADVCRILGIANPSDALSRLDDDEKNTLVLTEGIPGNPENVVVNEPGRLHPRFSAAGNLKPGHLKDG